MLIFSYKIKNKGGCKHDGGGINLISRLLTTTWGDLFKPNTDKIPDGYKDYSWMTKIFDSIGIVLYIILGIVGAVGAIYAIYLGVQLARAEDQSKRDDAKKHLITVLIAVAVTIVLVLFFNILLPEIVKAFMNGKNIYDQSL